MRNERRMRADEDYYIVFAGSADDPENLSVHYIDHARAGKTMVIFSDERRVRDYIRDTLERPMAYLEQVESGAREARGLTQGYVVSRLKGRKILEAAHSESAEELRFAFNPDEIIDGLEAIQTKDVVFSLNDPPQPVAIAPATPDGEEPDFRYLLLPIPGERA